MVCLSMSLTCAVDRRIGGLERHLTAERFIELVDRRIGGLEKDPPHDH